MAVKDQFDASRFGIFADSEGLSNLSEMDLEQGEEFYGMARHCEGCGQRKQCQIPWSELYCLQYAVDPARVGQAVNRPDLFDTSWVYDPKFKCFHPNYKCNCHGNPVVLFNMTPRQAEQALHSAGRNGVVSDAQKNIIRTIGNVVKQLAGNVRPAQVQQMYQQGRQAPGMIRGGGQRRR